MPKNYWNSDTGEAFREFWVDPYGGSMEEPFENIEPALSFGWNRALTAEYPNETWGEIEEDLEKE